MTTGAPNENPITIIETREFTMPKNSGDISAISTGLGIRQSYLSHLDLGTSRLDDIFSLEIRNDGSVILRKKRENGLQPGEKKVNASFPLPLEAVYKNMENGPTEFNYIGFKRNPSNNTYTLLGFDGLSTGITIPTNDLDTFKKEVGKLSGKIITECSSKKAQWELACEINPKNESSNKFTLNSVKFWDFMGETINMSMLSKITQTEGKKILEILITNFYKSQKK